MFDERDPAVRALIAQAIREARRLGTKIGLCGQAPSDYPEFARFLVECGIDSMSLNPDAVLPTTRLVLDIEGQDGPRPTRVGASGNSQSGKEAIMRPRQAAAPHPADAEIFARARRALDDRPSIPSTVRVHIVDGVAFLTGTSRRPEARSEAEDAVRRVTGVQRVVNTITSASPPAAVFEPPGA